MGPLLHPLYGISGASERYSLLRLECHLISISNLNLLGLFSTKRSKRDPEKWINDWDLRTKKWHSKCRSAIRCTCLSRSGCFWGCLRVRGHSAVDKFDLHENMRTSHFDSHFNSPGGWRNELCWYVWRGIFNTTATHRKVRGTLMDHSAVWGKKRLKHTETHCNTLQHILTLRNANFVTFWLRSSPCGADIPPA